MFKTLYSKLAAALVGLFVLVGVVFAAIAAISTKLYYSELTQRANANVAMYIAEHMPLMEKGVVNEAILEDLAHQVMTVNPSAEVYLLDLEGNIVSYLAPAEKIKRQRVDLAAVESFVLDTGTFPLVGDDPRNPGERKIFSAAELRDGADLQGYLYVILGGETYESIAAAMRSSYVLRLSLWAIISTIGFTILAGLLVFGLLTRRIRRLTQAVKQYRVGTGEIKLLSDQRSSGNDEVAQLGRAFESMAERISNQVVAVERADRLRRELITNVSHDLRTPLASMQGYIETLLLKEDRLTSAQRREYLQIARKHAERLRRLVTDLFELAKLDSGTITPHFEKVCLAELIQDVGQKYRLRAEEKGIELLANPGTGLPYVRADMGLIERVLENLIENALRYTPSGGRVTLDLHGIDNQVVVNVTDTGCGIAKSHLLRVFDRFYREHGSGHPDNAGLGLAIVKRIMQLHEGTIHVQSRVNVGTTFTFGLPTLDVPALEPVALRASSDAQNTPAKLSEFDEARGENYETADHHP